MLWNLVLLGELYVYEIKFNCSPIRYGKIIKIFEDKYFITCYKFGEKHGIEKVYNTSGEIIASYIYKKGILHGKFFNKRDLYCTILGRYVKGHEYGLWKYKYSNGTTHIRKFANASGGCDTWVKEYDSSGILQRQGREILFIRKGKWCHYDREGRKIKEEFYGDLNFSKIITYYANGCIKCYMSSSVTIDYDCDGHEIKREYGRRHNSDTEEFELWNMLN